MNVSELTLGTWAMGGLGWGEIERNQAITAIQVMLDHGVNFIDTAIGYGNAEEIVGEAIKGRREKVFITTKCGVIRNMNHPVHDGSRENVIAQCEESLQHLETDYIDLYLVHWPDNNTPLSETMEAMRELKQSGKIRYVGVSNFSLEQIFEADQILSIDAFQPEFSMVNRAQEHLTQWVHDHHIGIMSYGSLGGGILSGAFRKLPQFNKNDMRYIFYDSFIEPKFSKVMELLKTLDKIAAAHNGSVSQVAINWNTQKEFIDTTIVGVRDYDHAIQNCMGMSWCLTDAEIVEIDSAIGRILG